MSLHKEEALVIDNSPEADLLKISFNIRCAQGVDAEGQAARQLGAVSRRPGVTPPYRLCWPQFPGSDV
jgi:hypothetical protein